MRRVTVGRVRSLITTKPSLVGEDATLDEVAEEILRDPKTRSVYVLDSERKLVGIIPVIELIQYMYYEYIPSEYITYRFPLALSREPRAKDIMLPPVHVTDNDFITEAFRIMFKENLRELPVVDKSMHVIGDLNILELIVAWKEMKANAN